jgi:hypothetical protein
MQPDELISEIIEDVWKLFSEIRPILETINNETKNLD